MSLKVGQLQQSTGIGARMESILRETLNLVDTRIREADRYFGRNVVSIEIDTSFAIPGLAKKDQQRYVYSRIISSLKERGFEVRITLEDGKTVLYVAFTIDFSEEELKAMNQLIRSTRLDTAAEVDEFCRRGERDAPVT